MMSAAQPFTKPQPAVIPTAPANMALFRAARSCVPAVPSACRRQLSKYDVRAAPAILISVSLMARAAATMSTLLPSSTEDPLKLSHPKSKMNVPKLESTGEWPFITKTSILPFSSFRRPRRGPTSLAPMSAARPPQRWTRPLPAKSKYPALARKPSLLHPQNVRGGYIKPTMNTLNSKYAVKFMRSATPPLTIVAVVPAKT
mmetsp:Transcript_50814/g.74337  ORF Transcript_50814/g.74337 Transcript_50814/m.74337 type:complete len:201 (-) Transcript_50814:463-1065(-)